MRAKTLGFDEILIITSYDLTAQAKETANNISKEPGWGVKADWWTRYELTSLVLDYPDVRSRFSLGPTVPPVIDIGILNGYTSNPPQGTPCDMSDLAVSPNDWIALLKSKQIRTSLIPANHIRAAFDAIINPFGEAYPEEDVQSRTTYERILKYIGSGGLFVNVAGFPFFRYCDPITGQRKVATNPTTTFVDPQTGQPLSWYSFADTRLYRDFKVTVDTGVAREVQVFQEPEDKRCLGDLLAGGVDRVTQFRAITPPSPATPLLRDKGNKLYPIAAVPYKHGYLLDAGLVHGKREASLVAQATKNWLLTAAGTYPLSSGRDK